MSKSIVAIITARGGSKGLPRKNVLDLNGKPLIAHTIEAAIKSKIFDKVIVTTDDKEIKDVSLKYGAVVIDRPKKLSTDTASSLDAIAHALRKLEKNGKKFTHFMLLQPTSPLRTAKHIKESWKLYKKEDANSLVSVVEVDHPPQKMLICSKDGDIRPFTKWEDLTKPRQKLSKAYLPNGAIYINSVDKLLESKDIFTKPLSVFKMDKESSIDIDSKDDLKNCEKLIKDK